MSERTEIRPVSVGEDSLRVTAIRVAVIQPGRLRTGYQVHKRPKMRAGNLDDIVAFLPERLRYGLSSVGRDMQQDYPDAQVLHFGNDLREVFLGAGDDRIADGAVPGQRDQVAVDLGLDALAVAGTHPPEPQLEPGQVGEQVMLVGAAPLDRCLIPVAAQQGQAGPVP